MSSQAFGKQLESLVQRVILGLVSKIHLTLTMTALLILVVGGVLTVCYDLAKLAFFETDGAYAGLYVVCVGMVLSAAGKLLALVFPNTLIPQENYIEPIYAAPLIVPVIYDTRMPYSWKVCGVIFVLGTIALSHYIAKFITPAYEEKNKSQARAPFANVNPKAETYTPSANVKNAARKPRKTLESLQGMVELKAKLLKIGTEAVDGLSNQDGRNGVLLHGLPGNGKTTIAEALAGSLKLPFMYITFGSVGSSWVNQTTEQVVEVFRDAEKQAPCVLFLDEIDSLLRERSGPQGESESSKTVNVLLTELINIRGKGVLVMAATNHLDMLDGAGVREGRFDFKVEVTPPDQIARVAILESSITKMAAAQRKTLSALKKSTLESVCSRWEGFSAARIDAVGKAVVDLLDAVPAGVVDATLIKQALRVVQGIAIEPNPKAFDGLAFEESTIESLSDLAYRMAHIEDIEAMGGSVPRGVLFHGDPGTGKTKSAKALAEAAGCSLISTSGITLMKDPEEIDKILAKAALNRPCVVFIDEADDVFGERNGSASSNAVTNKMLAAMDGTGANVKDVMFIAATNHPDRFDSAALRGGRFTTKVLFQLPSAETMGKLVDIWQRGLKVPVSKLLTREQLVRMLIGNSHANAMHALDGSVNAAISRHKRTKSVLEITEADLAKSMLELGL